MKGCAMILLCLIQVALQVNGTFVDYGQYRDTCIDTLNVNSEDYYEKCDRNETPTLGLDIQNCASVEYCIWGKLELVDTNDVIDSEKLTEYVRFLVDIVNILNSAVKDDDDPQLVAAKIEKDADEILTLCKPISGDAGKERIAKLSYCIDTNNFKRFKPEN